MNFKSFGQLLREMLDFLAGSASALTDFNVGSATRSLMEGVALVLAELHFLGQQLIGRFFVSTATGQWLDMRGAEYAIPRVVATPTLRDLVVSHGAGAPAVAIPVGWRAATLPGATIPVTYQAILPATLPAGAASVVVEVISLSAGAETAIPDGTPLQQIGTPLPGIEAIATATVEVAGTDREPDDPYRQRILTFMRSPVGPGSVSDYEAEVINAFEGQVGSVYIEPQWDGPGTVRVLILGPDNTIPSPTLVAQVQAHLDAWAPIGASVTVQIPAIIHVDVRGALTVAAGYTWAEALANASAAVVTHLDGLDVGEDVLLAGVADAIFHATGVANHGGLEQRVAPLAFGTDDIVLDSPAKAVSGVLSFSQGT